jgi:hypothetical protein
MSEPPFNWRTQRLDINTRRRSVLTEMQVEQAKRGVVSIERVLILCVLVLLVVFLAMRVL